ncbi:MAG: cytochrome c biogenesis protein CcdA [Phycisphaerales bacterium]
MPFARTLFLLLVAPLASVGPALGGPPAAATPADTAAGLPTLSAPAITPARARRPQGEEVRVRAVVPRSPAYAGEQLPVAVVIDHADGFHTWPQQDVLPPDVAEFAIRTTITATPSPTLKATVHQVQYPQPHPAPVASPTGEGTIQVPSYSNIAVAFVPITLAPDAASGTLKLTVRLQACTDRFCLQPQTIVFDVPIDVVPLPAAGASATPRTPNEPELFAAFDQSAFARAAAGGASGLAKPVKFEVFGWSFSINASGTGGTAGLLLLAALGGLLLNFTPCVLPIIPIKILGLSQAAGDPRRCLLLGSMMSLGVVLFWLCIGAAIAFISGFKTINTLFQNPAFPIFVGAFMLVMGSGMLGAFNFRLPNIVYMIDPSRESVPGSVGFGIMTAVLSTPCTAPFMGAAAAWAATQPPAITLATFTSIGIGMALPYLLLSANPAWVKKLPRTGPASELLKQVMGILILAVAAFFLGLGISSVATRPPQPPTLVYWWAVGIIAAAGGLWLAWRTWAITRSALRRLTFAVLGVGFAVAALGAAAGLSSRGPINWVYYTPELHAQALQEKKVVVMDFTADWCLNCKALEAAVLHRAEIVALLASDGVVPVKVDLTADNEPGNALLRELQWVGIPLLAIYGPGLSEPIKLDTYTVQVVKDAVEKARAKPRGG